MPVKVGVNSRERVRIDMRYYSGQFAESHCFERFLGVEFQIFDRTARAEQGKKVATGVGAVFRTTAWVVVGHSVSWLE